MIFYYIVFYEYSLDFQKVTSKVKFVIFILIELFFDKK